MRHRPRGGAALRAWAYARLGWPTLVSYIAPATRARSASPSGSAPSLDPGAGAAGPMPCVFRHPVPEAAAMTAAPRLESAPPSLRPHRLDDFPPVAAFFDQRLRSLHRRAARPAPRLARLRRGRRLWELLRLRRWAIEEKATGAFAGQVGLYKPPHFPSTRSAGSCSRRSNAAALPSRRRCAARAYAYDTLGWTTAVSYVDRANPPRSRLP